MLQPKTLAAVALLGLLAGAAANADHRYYRSEPQVRLGLDVIWGGYGYAPPPPPHVGYAPPPAAWYPSYYGRGYDRGHDRAYNRANWRGKGHHKHGRDHRHEDDCDD
ncbi:MAG: hypothetical protein ABIX37_08505 [Gammaproteobacteria bacterium]